MSSKHAPNDSDCSLGEVVLQTIERFRPAFDSLQQKLRQAAQKSFMSAVIKQLLTSLILVALAFYFFHDPSLDPSHNLTHDHELIIGFTTGVAVFLSVYSSPLTRSSLLFMDSSYQCGFNKSA